VADPASAPTSGPDEVMTVAGLTVGYAGAPRPAVDDVSFELRRGEMLGLVGESGSGKTTMAMAVLGLSRPPAKVLSGAVRLEGQDLLSLPSRALRRLRWSAISLVPQGAMNALSPVMRVGAQIEDVLRTHTDNMGRREARDRAAQLLASVELGADVARMFPHQLSGGMKQRVCIAMAIALQPKVIVADEPTSALDVVVQRAVARTLVEVQGRLGASLLLIGHDMALQAQLADRVGVMCQGRLVEIGPVRAIFQTPEHPYTRLLLRSVPSLRRASWEMADDGEELRQAEGGHLDLHLPLRPVGDDHLAAVP
jgi:peptide/nickel transport system ATP-binding protein